MYIKAFEHVKAGFTEWLLARGAEVPSPKSEWEVMRFVYNGQTRIIYKNKHGALSFMYYADVFLYSYLKEAKIGNIANRLLADLWEPTDQQLWDSGVLD